MEIKDYIGLTRHAYMDKYDIKDMMVYADMMDEAETLEFQEDHVPRSDVIEVTQSQDRDASIKDVTEELQDRGFSDKYIEDYIEFLTKGTDTGKLSKTSLKEILINFKYRNRKLRPNQLKSALNIDDITLVNKDKDTRKFLDDMLDTLKGKEFMSHYALGLSSLSDALETTDRKRKLKIERFDDSELIGVIDPKYIKSREKFYDFWSGVYDEYEVLQNAIKELLLNWEGLEKEVEELLNEEGETVGEKTTITNRKESETFFHTLDKELEVLHKLYEKMDSMNYVIKSRTVHYPVASDDELDTLDNVHNAMMTKIQELFDEAGDDRSGEEEDDDFAIDEEEEMIDLYGVNEEDVTGNTGATGEFGTGGGTVEETAENFKKQTGRKTRITDVDPLYAIAAQKGIVEDPFDKKSWEKFLEVLEQEIKEENEMDAGIAEDLQELLDEHKSRKEMISDAKREFYYIPYTQEVNEFLRHRGSAFEFNADYLGEQDLPSFDELEQFHLDLLEAIGNLLEDPLDRTSMPEIWDAVDMPSGGIAGREEKEDASQRELYNVFSRFRLGHLGSLREDLGEFEESMQNVLEAIQDYYVEPSQGEMQPFKDVPKFLRKGELARFMARGAPDRLISHLFTIFLEYGIGLIDNNDLLQINQYRTALTTTSPSKQNLETSVQNVLTILEEFTENMSLEYQYFGHILERIAKENDNVSLDDLKIEGQSVERLAKEYEKAGKPTPMYKYLIIFIASKSKLFKKDLSKKAQVEKFMSLHTERGDKIKLSIPERSILVAHDEIRKMLNKPTYLGFGDTSDFDNVNDTIDFVKKRYNVEITATDIVGIVSEFDNMNTIAKKFGVNEDVVYHVKAVFR